MNTCGAPKKVNMVTCEECVCDGKKDVQLVAKNALRVQSCLELMAQGGIEVVKVEPLLKLLKGK